MIIVIRVSGAEEPLIAPAFNIGKIIKNKYDG
jgi:hypothetical protein